MKCVAMKKETQNSTKQKQILAGDKKESVGKERAQQERITYIYIVECEDHSFYTGITTDVKRRMKEHYQQKGKGAKYTHSHKIREIKMVWEAETYASAARLEYAIKQLKREEKQKLVLNPEEVTKIFFPGLKENEYRVKKDYCGLVSDFGDIVK